MTATARNAFCTFLLSILLLPVAPSAAELPDLNALLGQEQEFLDVDEAFKLSADVLDDEILVNFEVAPEYYLYRHRFNFTADGATLGDAKMQDGVEKVDEYFGLVEVYFNHFEAAVPFEAHQASVILTVDFQGCAEAGLCYPPTTRTVELTIDDFRPGNTTATVTTAEPQTRATATPARPDAPAFQSEENRLLNILADTSLPLILLTFILLGVALTFTPCVFPMIPIISSIIAGQGARITTSRAFTLTLVYVLAMALTYALLGVAVASAGASLAGFFQHPVFVIGVAIVFVALALAMFGFYELQLPAGLQARLDTLSRNQKSGSLLGVAIMGALSALVVSPCVTAPLAAVLLFIAQSGDLTLGGLALFALGIGMGLPLLLIGTLGGKYFPGAGPWMNVIKAVFGVGMLALAIYVIKHLLPQGVYLALFGILAITSAVFMGALDFSVKSAARKLWQGLGLVLLVYGILLLIGAATGSGRLFQPLAGINTPGPAASQPAHDTAFIKVATVEETEAAIARANREGKTVMLDFFAEWCVSCYEFADYTFPDPAVQAALANTVLLQADVTANNEADRALMAKYRVLGLPSILLFDTNGEELREYRATGFENAETFAARLTAAFHSRD